MNDASECWDRKPAFSFTPPRGYEWLLEHGLAGYDAFSSLEPWYYLDEDSAFDVTNHWPQGPHQGHLVAFARRQDCDDIACFEVEEQSVVGVLVIHGWTSTGYDIGSTYTTFWEWLKSVVDDVAEWAQVTAHQ